ncbi:acyl-CoA dehydrogenase [Parapedobacter tibetensis]|uniref:acyl-CoA dehydrogenase n=1 Tax=Parapedobacter tibetensis TaxID=2972951 RepID=UPI00214D63C7|nr:acyl-CoA dehydrogenase [Parapedobacter tibetensis]
MDDKPFLADQLIEKLRAQSERAEVAGKLTDEQLAIIYDNKWFKLFVPKSFGGLELTVPEGVRLEEELAWIDGSLGWTITLCSGANLFVGYISQSIAPAMFSDTTVCLGGSGQASGKAIVENGGYNVTGKWRYATGAPHNTFFTANCVIEQDGKTVIDKEGNPLTKSFFFAKADVRVIEDWNAFGLKATASHSFAVDNLWVDESHAFLITPQHATLDHPIYRYPFLQFAEATLAANTLGMARHFIACADVLISQNQKGIEATKSLGLVTSANTQLKEIKQSFYDALDASWAELLHNGKVSDRSLSTVSALSRSLVAICHQQVVLLFPHCGMAATISSAEINRIWRDIFTASQHSLLR